MASGEELRPTEAQYAFGMQLRRGMERLFEYLGISGGDGTNGDERASSGTGRAGHRLYDAEIVEMGPDVSLVIVLPPPGM